MSGQLGGGVGGVPTRALVAAAALAVFLGLAVGIFDHEIWSPTEPAVAGVVWNMHASGSLAVPRIGDFPYLEKPPGYAWLGWLATRAGEVDAGWLRLPAGLLGLGVLGLVAAVVKRRHGSAIAAVAVLLGASCVPILELSHRASPDTLALFFAALAFALHLWAVGDAPGRKPGWGADVALALALGASFYAKNFLVLYTVMPPILLHRVWMRDVGGALRLGVATGLATVILVAPWALAVHAEGGSELLRVAFVDNTLGRFVEIAATERPDLRPLNDAYTAERDGALWVYLVTLPAVAAPWTLVAIASLPLLFRRGIADEHRRFLAIALVVVPLVLTLSSSRNSAYLRPLAFVAVLAATEWVAEVGARPGAGRAWQRALVVANLAIASIAIVVLPIFLAIRFGGAGFVTLAALWVAGAAAIVWRHRSDPGSPRAVFAVAALVVAGLAANLWLAVPEMDRERGSRPFFDAVRLEVQDRVVATTVVDDRRYPLLHWYLDRPVRVLADRDEALALLEGDLPVAVFASANGYRRTLRKWAGVPHRAVEAPSGKAWFVLLLNDPR